MTATRHESPASMPLAHLLSQAAAELNAQPAPPMPQAMFNALPAAATATTVVLADTPPTRRRWFALTAWLTPRHAAASAPAARAAPNGRSPRSGWPTVVAACSLMLVSVTVLLVLAAPPGRGDAASTPGFIPVAPQERWGRLQEDGGAAWVVTTELPQARLASYGLPFDPAHAADTVRAELLMRASGEVLAVRVLY